MFSIAKLKQLDIITNLLILLLGIMGLITVYSTTYSPTTGTAQDFWEQCLFWLVGICLYLFVSVLNIEIVKEIRVQIALCIALLVSLIVVLAFGEIVYGTRRWLAIGDFTFQPSEFAKLIIITLTASCFIAVRKLNLTQLIKLTKTKSQTIDLRHLLRANPRVVLNLILIPIIVGLIWIQPSLGNALIGLILWLTMLLSLHPKPGQVYAAIAILFLGANLVLHVFDLGGLYALLGSEIKLSGLDVGLISLSGLAVLLIGSIVKLRPMVLVVLLSLGILSALSLHFAWDNLLTSYQQERLIAYARPEEDPLGAYWQVKQSKIAIASGQVFGKGFLQGTQSSQGLLPFPQTDFVYAAFTEQFGLVGSLLLLFTFYALIIRVLHIGSQAQGSFDTLICVGVAMLIALNVVVNVGMNLGILPVTGVPLPLVSYGGSAILVNLLGLGLVQLVYTNQSEKLEYRKLGSGI